ncbi:magnesium transporter CorA family protein [Chelativorans salis]|uniref:Magnesium transporter CorA family protein n=1 Tax=Chelativorans salis TaxID=2978478 RepID=A0ABT2LGS0_9HYPH|nr:magnesium transporter CorA family protein [Chelativorans sp. EGI FJ00035]MCT7373472.1 magnesium transporter CorA family protein [Chelativorans sp. EGI FJ00035]
MIQVFCMEGDYLRRIDPKPDEALPADVLWIDLLNPSAEEDKVVETWTGASIPTTEDMVEIEESSRFYTEGGVKYLTAPILHKAEMGQRKIAPISFVLTERLLVTVRYSEPKAIELYISRATKPGSNLLSPKCSGRSVMLGIIEAATDRLADVLEDVTEEIETASQAIWQKQTAERPMSTKEFRRLLTRIGSQGTFLSKVRESLSGIGRLLAYVQVAVEGSEPRKETRTWIKSLERDTQSLENYVDYLSNKITFLLDTVVGLISVEQNAIIKIFSVAAVGLMPPTLIASIYGMNFRFMPELNETWGYPVALGVMVLSAILPLFYFRRKGWL